MLLMIIAEMDQDCESLPQAAQPWTFGTSLPSRLTLNTVSETTPRPRSAWTLSPALLGGSQNVPIPDERHSPSGVSWVQERRPALALSLRKRPATPQNLSSATRDWDLVLWVKGRGRRWGWEDRRWMELCLSAQQLLHQDRYWRLSPSTPWTRLQEAGAVSIISPSWTVGAPGPVHRVQAQGVNRVRSVYFKNGWCSNIF